MIRAFVAVLLSESLLKNLTTLQSELQRRMAYELPRDVGISWVRSHSLHVTMKFLGDIDERLVGPLEETIGHALAVHRALDVPINRLGGFPNIQQPRILWAGPTDQWEKGEGGAQLGSLHRAIDDACASLNLARDTRSLTAHLTLARVRAGARFVGQLLAKSGVIDQALALGSMAVDRIALMKSDLKPTGSVYTKLWDVVIGGGYERPI
jgi:RNA 2',3'-cyclic 3'-phosphodiesterase